MKVIQALLRHSRLGTTADIYAHVSESLAQGAATTMDQVLNGK